VPKFTGVDSLFLEFQEAVAGRYSLDRELGRGGMGIVYLAREVRLDRLVAIKLLPPAHAADSVIRERFVREARMAAQLSHPNIIPIHAVEEAGDFVYFVMAYIDGETLTQRVQKRGPLSAAEGARVLREVAWALAFAHQRGVIHRDIKPDNILLEAGSGRALVADFGVAALQQDTAPEGVVTGTPEFMSPEQALGEPVDARSDLYSVGATAFYMFSGRFPFEGRTPTEVIAQHVGQRPPTVASLGRPVPRKLAAIIDRCLSKAPSGRPVNGQVLAEQLSVTLEERREMPVALRSFLKVARLDSRGTLAEPWRLWGCRQSVLRCSDPSGAGRR
jgi:eukaryotic-like serine/threonine-protein kinase